MAEIVLGIGASHSPQVSMSWEMWPNMRRTEERSPAIPANLTAQLEPHVLEERFGAVQRSVQTLAEVLQSTPPLDAIVIFGERPARTV